MREWSAEECQQRVQAFTRAGRLLPSSWEETDVLPPDAGGSYADTLMPVEYAELALYVEGGKNLYTPYIFRDYISAARLRACIPEIAARKAANGDAWKASIAIFDRERRARREGVRNIFEQRIAYTASLGRG